MLSLSIIGCGKVGMVIGRLFRERGLVEIRDILNRSLESGGTAAAFIGGGRPVSDYRALQPAEMFLIAAADDAIAACAARLAESGVLRPGNVVWHLSGALPSTVLAPVQAEGASVASVHPVRSFADAALSVAEFDGTWCGLEGDGPALAPLAEAIEAVGGITFAVDARFKTVYHAGAVITCNYLTALMEVGLRSYEKAGLSRETALKVIEPLVRGTVDNIFRAGTEQALTGPIARGDAAVVARQLSALDEWDGELALIYRALGRVALDLARRRGGAQAGHDAIAEVLAAKG